MFRCLVGILRGCNRGLYGHHPCCQWCARALRTDASGTLRGDVDPARVRHGACEQALRDAGCVVHQLQELVDPPDSVCVEGNVIALDEVAALVWPGIEPRRGEIASIAVAVTPWRELRHIAAPATPDGGNVLRLGHVLHVGASVRSNAESMGRLAQLVAPFGYRVQVALLHECLHLKSVVTRLATDTLLVNPDGVDTRQFPAYRTLAVDPAESFAAHAVWIGDPLLHSASFPRTVDLLHRAGVGVLLLEMSETGKAEGGVTCCSVIFGPWGGAVVDGNAGVSAATTAPWPFTP